MKTLKAGIVGLGVGEAHLRAYQALPNVEVTRICDINPVRGNEIGERYGVAERSMDYRDVTEARDVDVVSICSYDDSHAEQAVSAFNHGKHVMVEKPIALHRSEMERVYRAFEDSGKLLTSNLILRHSPRFRMIRDMIAAGDFGEIFHIEGDYLHQILWKIIEGWRGKMDFYCTFYGGGIHLVDLMRWMMDEEITEVSAMGTDILTRNTGYAYPDTITSLMRFSGGATGKCTTTLGPQRTKFHALNVYGTKASFVNDLPHGKLFRSDMPEDESIIELDYNPSMDKGGLLSDFVSAIREDRKPIVNEVDVFRVMDVCLTIWDSTQSKRTETINYII